MKPKNTQISFCRSVAKITNSTISIPFAAVIGLAFAAVSGANGQVSSINSAYVDPNSNFQPPIPGSVFTSSTSGNPQNDTLNVSLNEANVRSEARRVAKQR